MTQLELVDRDFQRGVCCLKIATNTLDFYWGGLQWAIKQL